MIKMSSSLSFTELDFLNETKIPPTYSCPAGYVLIDKYCSLIPNMSCPPGYSISNGICMKTSSAQMMSPAPPQTGMSPVPPPQTGMSPVPPQTGMMSPVPPPQTGMVSPAPCPVGFERKGNDTMCSPIV
jgi:hypothetical protein